MKRVKTADLIGAALDWAVAKANGWVDYPKDSIEHGAYWHKEPDRAPFGRRLLKELYTPSTEWAQGGPIIEREGGTLWSTVADGWRCKAKYDYTNDREGLTTSGPTSLIAAMRCFAASKLGDEVEVPEELLP